MVDALKNSGGKVYITSMGNMSRLKPIAEMGFTLIEMLVVIAIIGILTAIAIPQFAAYRRTAYDSEMVSDLRNAATAEEAYYSTTLQYTKSIADLNAGGFTSSPNVTLTITVNAGPPPIFTMTATHSNCAAGSTRTINSTDYSFGGAGCQ